MSKKWLSKFKNGLGNLADGLRPGPPPPPEALRIRELLARAAKPLDPDTPLSKLRFVVVDTETTGFEPAGGDEVIALGAVVVENGRPCPEQTFHRLVNPGRPIPPLVTALTGIADEVVAGEEDLVAVLQGFLPFLGSACLVGHHVAFDLQFLNFKLREFSGANIHNPVLDTAVIARALYPTLKYFSLDTLLAVHGIEPAGRHTALGDAWLTARLLELQLELLEMMRITKVAGLFRLLETQDAGFMPGF
ncbi:MAG: exonuclease domain-containing protein [Bacillota bacterium]